MFRLIDRLVKRMTQARRTAKATAGVARFLELAGDIATLTRLRHPWAEGVMAAGDPRLATYWDELDAHISSVTTDGTVVAPTLGAGGYVPSTSVGKSVTLVNAGTTAPQVGLGSSGNELYGKVKQVSTDAIASVQDRGYMTFAFVATNPAPNVAVGVDGTGKVTQTAGNKQAFCVGYTTDPQSGNTVCVVKKN